MIKFLVMDVDGTLTDGNIYMGNNDEIMKAFNIKDGCGIKDILPRYGIVPVIITARRSKSLQLRCNELGISELHQGVRDKKDKLLEIIEVHNERENTNYTLRNCAYIGDDILDIPCMKSIKSHEGIVGCPADAVQEVKALVDFMCVNKAGTGAVREFIEYLTRTKLDSKCIEDRVNRALEYLMALDVASVPVGKRQTVTDDFFFTIQSYVTKPTNLCKLESHRKFIDIQIMVEGQEVMDIVDISRLTVKEEYDEENDVVFWCVPSRMARTTLKVGDCIILYPENAHRGAVLYKEDSKVLKIVGKVRAN